MAISLQVASAVRVTVRGTAYLPSPLLTLEAEARAAASADAAAASAVTASGFATAADASADAAAATAATLSSALASEFLVATGSAGLTAERAVTDTATIAWDFATGGQAKANILSNPVATGGTGRASHTAYAVLCGGTTSTAAQQSIASVGSAGQVLTSNGAGALPTFQSAAAGGMPLGYLSGLTLSNNVSDATNDIDIAAGAARDDTNAADLTLASALTKRLDAAWAVGTNQGGLDTGSIADTTYHVWLIRRSDTGVVDVLFSTSATSPTMPTNYDGKRRIGSIIRASSAILAFVQLGNEFLLKASVLSVSGGSMSTTAASATLTVPNGIVVKARVGIRNNAGTATVRFWAYSPQVNDEAAAATNATSMLSSTTPIMTVDDIWTNTSRQIRVVADVATGTYDVRTYGWMDQL